MQCAHPAQVVRDFQVLKSASALDNSCYADWKVDSKASEANGIVSCPGVENTRLIDGRFQYLDLRAA